jgi:hypothetical protein
MCIDTSRIGLSEFTTTVTVSVEFGNCPDGRRRARRLPSRRIADAADVAMLIRLWVVARIALNCMSISMSLASLPMTIDESL